MLKWEFVPPEFKNLMPEHTEILYNDVPQQVVSVIIEDGPILSVHVSIVSLNLVEGR